jgi:Tol biopolymer transport system component
MSPDGMRVAYTLSDGLWVQDLDRLEPAHRIYESEGAAQPFWSPDGTSIGFFDLATLTLMRVPAEGGTAQKISTVPRPNVGGGAWGRNGTIYFACRAGWASRGGGGLYEVAADGGAAVLRAAPREDEVGFTSPLVLPDTGDVLAVLATTKGRRHVVRIFGASSVQILDVTHAGSSVVLAHARPGHLLYGSPAGLWAVALDPTRTPLQVSGQPVRIADEGNRSSVSDDGQLLYVPKPEAARRLVWVNRRGEVIGTIGQAQSSMTEPALSPDGTRVAVRGVEGGKTDIWIHDAARGTKTRLTSEPGNLSQPCWTANGRDLVYVDDQGRSEGRIVARRADGGDRPRLLVNTPVVLYEPDVSRDGRFGVFVAHDPDRNMFTDLWYAELEGTSKAMPFEESPFTKLRPRISPDGRYVAYSSNEGNAHQIYVRSFPTGEGKWTISTQGGTSPRWSRDGRTLYFVKGNSLVAVSIDTGRDITVGPPVELFRGDRAGAVLFSPESPYDLRYDVAADEQRFVVVQSVLSPLAGLALIEHWTSALARPNEKAGGSK